MSSNQTLTNDQVQQLLGVLTDLLGSIGNIGGLASQGIQLNVKNEN